jgi:OOP family OmpA-OmpF porin
MEKYLTHNLDNSLEKITEAGGLSPLHKALDAAKTDLKGLSGNRTAVIIVSDGLDLPGGAVESAKELSAMYGPSLCFYTILVGDPAQGESLLKEIAAIGGCGFYSTADELLTSAGMASFVEKIFLDKIIAPAPKPAPAPVRLDSDQDGVYDEDDQCPGTPLGAKVNAVGCWVLENVLFDFDKAVIKPIAYPLLDDVVAIFEKNPGMRVELQGHCDNIGTADYNMGLSERRALAVKTYLMGQGVAESRLTTKGFGFTKPVALNGTESGRSLNRRVELHPQN